MYAGKGCHGELVIQWEEGKQEREHWSNAPHQLLIVFSSAGEEKFVNSIWIGKLTFVLRGSSTPT